MAMRDAHECYSTFKQHCDVATAWKGRQRAIEREIGHRNEVRETGTGVAKGIV